MKKIIMLVIGLVSFPTLADINIAINLVDAKGTSELIGSVTARESKYGVVFTPSLKGLSPGLHGFHVHQNPSCQPKEKDGKVVPGLAAGGHYDPYNAKAHGTPWGEGHLGDLPPLFIDAKGNASQPVLAPRIKLSDLKGRSLMIHAGADNHSDHPKKLGGGGSRVACGVI